jgi:hypothetical protein
MTHNIEIPDPVFVRLQELATPFVDHPATVIERLLNFYYTQNGATPNGVSTGSEPTTNCGFDPCAAPDLHHTKLLQAEFAGHKARTWNQLTQVAHAIVLGHGNCKRLDEARSISGANLFLGERTNCGFHFIRQVGISIQGVNANVAWQQTLKLAKHLRVSVQVEFRWLDKPAAQHPSETGHMAWHAK